MERVKNVTITGREPPSSDQAEAITPSVSGSGMSWRKSECSEPTISDTGIPSSFFAVDKEEWLFPIDFYFGKGCSTCSSKLLKISLSIIFLINSEGAKLGIILHHCITFCFFVLYFTNTSTCVEAGFSSKCFSHHSWLSSPQLRLRSVSDSRLMMINGSPDLCVVPTTTSTSRHSRLAQAEMK